MQLPRVLNSLEVDRSREVNGSVKHFLLLVPRPASQDALSPMALWPIWPRVFKNFRLKAYRNKNLKKITTTVSDIILQICFIWLEISIYCLVWLQLASKAKIVREILSMRAAIVQNKGARTLEPILPKLVGGEGQWSIFCTVKVA